MIVKDSNFCEIYNIVLDRVEDKTDMAIVSYTKVTAEYLRIFL